MKFQFRLNLNNIDIFIPWHFHSIIQMIISIVSGMEHVEGRENQGFGRLVNY